MRVEFLSDLEVLKLGREWRLLSPFRIALDSDALSVNRVAGAIGCELIVPAGFDTDFASVPRVPLAFLLAGDTAHKAAVVHDWLYAERAPRELADQVFRAAMKAEGISSWRRALMYAAVRIGGAARYAERAQLVEEGR